MALDSLILETCVPTTELVVPMLSTAGLAETLAARWLICTYVSHDTVLFGPTMAA